MWIKFLSSTLFLCFSIKIVDCKRTFLVVGPQTIPYQGEYSVAVSTFGFDYPENLEITIFGILEDGNRYESSKNINLQNNELEEVKFDLQDQTPGNYFMRIRNEMLEQSVKLNLNTKTFSVLIQTDKKVYKPGDKMQFRILVLNPDTTPFITQSVELFITDGNFNRIKQYDNAVFNYGVMDDELQLSEYPVFGIWEIHIRVNDQEPEVVKQFEVAEFKMPKFEVTVNTKEKISLDDDIVVSFIAKYVNGKEVEGTATVTVDFTDQWSDPEREKIIKVLDNSTKTTSINIKDDMKLYDISDTRTGFVTVSFTEAITGKQENKTVIIVLHKSPHIIDSNVSGNNAKPGLPYTVKLFVKNIDNIPVTDEKVHIVINVTYTLKSKSTSSSAAQHFLPSWQLPKKLTVTLKKMIKNGIVEVPINVTPNVTFITLNALYKGATGNFYIGTRTSQNNQYIDIKVPDGEIPMSKSTTIEIISTVEVERIDYVIFARNKLQDKGQIKNSKSKSFKFDLHPTFEMIPSAELIAFYVSDNEEIIADRRTLKFEKELKNFLDIELSKTEAKPNSCLNISIKSQSSSYVGLMAYDQKALLESGNYFTRDMIFNDLSAYSVEDIFNNDLEENVILDNYRDFCSKCTVLTNADKEYQHTEQLLPSSEIPFEVTSSKKVTKTNLVDTWFFDHIVNIDGSISLAKKVPAQMTSWIITGFSLNYKDGLGLTKQPSKVKVFMPFFIYLNLPYSIKRGEIISIQAIIFNYMKDDYPATVTMSNENQEFEFVENTPRADHDHLTKTISATANSGTSVSFVIKALKIGYITLKIEASTSVAGDRVEQQLLIEAEGITRYINEAILVDLRTQHSFSKSIEVVVPNNFVPDSLKIEASFIGDLLGPALNNLENLIQIPSGNGEQNMLKFVVNILALDYLISVNKLTPEIFKKSKIFLETGYQSVLTYKLDEGSYSAFGQLDEKGSTWLTAFVARSFNYALKYITIDDDAITQALSFLHSEQKKDGRFPEVGTVYRKEMQGGSSNGIGLTAFVLLTFLENESYNSSFKRAISRAVDNIVRNVDKIEDAYTMSIASYALHLAGKKSVANLLLDKLDQRAINSDEMRHWDVISNNDYITSLAIETSGYVLLAYLEANRSIDALLVAKWLISQRNYFGGFESTQDTVVGLLALSKMATKLSKSYLDLKIDLKYKNIVKSFNIDQTNALVLQKLEIPSCIRNFKVSAIGSGLGLAQISYHYNVFEPKKSSNFILIANVTSNDAYSLTLKVCVGVKNMHQLNMAVMEIATLSGYIFDSESLSSLTSLKNNIKKNEARNGKTLVNIYFDSLQAKIQCFNVESTKAFEIKHSKPASVVVYEAYSTNLRAEILYTN